MSENSENIKKKTLSGFAWRFFERLLTQGISFIISIVLARLLLPKEYGVIAIVTIFISLADVFVTNGLGTALIQKKDADDLDSNTVFYAGIVLSLALYVLVYLSAPVIAVLYDSPAVVSVLRVMGLRIPIAALNSVQQAIISRKMEFKKLFYSTFFGTVLSGVLGIVLAYTGFGVWALVAQNVGNSLINCVILFVTVKWYPKWMFSVQRLKGLFSFGSKLMLSNFIGVLFNQIRGLIIGAKYTSTDLAYYNRGEKIPTLISTNIEASIDSVLFPVLSKFQDDKEKSKHTSKRFLQVGSYIITPLMVGLAITSENIIRVLLTDKWLPSLPFMQIISIHLVFSILNTANLQVIKAQGQGDILVKLEFLKKPIYIIILFITMNISPYAMAVGTLIYEFVAAAINSRPTKQLIGYSLFEQLLDILPSILLSAAMGVCVYLTGLLPFAKLAVLLLQVLVGVIVYVGLSFVLSISSFRYILNTLKNLLQRK